MRTHAAFCIALLLPLAANAAPPTTRPSTTKATTKPAAKPKQIIKILKGSVRMAVPADWTEASRQELPKGGAVLTFTTPDEVAMVTVQVQPQEYPVPQKSVSFHDKVKNSIIADMKKAMLAKNQEILYGPRSETDDRFFQRIHTRVKDGHDTLDELHLFRAAGLDLLIVMCVVKADTPDAAAPYHTAAEDLCLSITVGAAEKDKP